MLKGNFYFYTFFLSYICNLNFFVNFQCQFLSFLNDLLSEFLPVFNYYFIIIFGMNKRSYSEIAVTFL